MKKTKKHIWVPIGFILLFITAFLGSMVFWNTGLLHSEAEDATTPTTVKNNSSGTVDIITVDTTFYNYRYDNEIYYGNRDQGAQSCYDESGVIPFKTFDKKLSAYYKTNNVKSGLYTGNFYHYYGGLPGSKNLPWLGYSSWHWAANIANRRSPYNSVCQGLVSSKLNGFTKPSSADDTNITSGTLMMPTNSGSVAVPYFDKIFLTSDNNKVNGVAIGAVKEHVGFPFRKITTGSKKGYYEFDSKKDVVRFDGGSGSNSSTTNAKSDAYYFGTKGQLEYYNTSDKQVKYQGSATDAQFLPFNQAGASQVALDYGFGVRYNIPFRLSDDGKIDGEPMVFNFSGDDDVWVFVDGKLVLDLGGQHGRAEGTIDFSQEKVVSTVAKVTYPNGSTDAADTATSDNITAADTYIKENVTTTTNIALEKGDSHLHVITVFYMERGMFESNFYMTFNFVPAGEPMPTAMPATTPAADVANGRLNIKNVLKFPTINSAFSQNVYDMAEEDIFAYTIKNQGTSQSNVGNSEINYASGKLTVRQNTNTTSGKAATPVKSYLSFGAQSNSKIRIYINMEAVVEYYQKNWRNGDPVHYQKISLANIISAGTNPKLTSYEDVYYFDIDGTKFNSSGEATIQFETSHFDIPNSQKIKLYYGTSSGSNKPITINQTQDGYFLIPQLSDKTTGTSGNNIWFNEIIIEEPSDKMKYPPLNDGSNSSVNYSNTLPNQTAGPVATFAPTTSTDLQPVAKTSYQLTEAYPAPTDSNILVNSEKTSGITDTSGVFGLFYNDSATFLRQFAKGSRMQVVQNDALMQPSRYSSGTTVPTSSTSVDTALTKFITPSPDVARSAGDYYYTTVEAKDSTNNDISVTYDGQYNFVNANEDENVDITQTFTNTVKTGSLTISKTLKGNLQADENYSYKYTVSFSNVFGDSSTEANYSGSYTLTKSDGTTEAETTSDGTITLQPGQSATISGIPVGTKYKIVETSTDGTVVSEIKAVYKASSGDETITSPTYKATTDADLGLTVDETNKTIEGVIPCRVTDKSYGRERTDFSEVDVTVSYTNRFGSISITKKISGDAGEADYYYGQDKEYKFKVTYTKNDDATIHNYNDASVVNYKVSTYTYPDGYYNEPVIVSTTVPASNDGIISLKEGQEAEIGQVPLTEGRQYTIQEIFDTSDNSTTKNMTDTNFASADITDIYYVKDINVTEGTAADDGNLPEKAKVTTVAFDNSNPTFEATFTNRYSNSYIEIDKYVDALYYGDRTYAEGLTYQTLTDANQGFIFEIKQYKTKAEAEDETATPEKTYEVVLYLGNDTTKLDSAKTFDSKSFHYKTSQKVKVRGNRYYRIQEKTDWAWKYKFVGAQATLPTSLSLSGYPTRLSSTDASTVIDSKVVILKSYLDSTAIPIAEFYNQMDEEKNVIDGDTDSAVNKLYKEGTIIDQ